LLFVTDKIINKWNKFPDSHISGQQPTQLEPLLHIPLPAGMDQGDQREAETFEDQDPTGTSDGCREAGSNGYQKSKQSFKLILNSHINSVISIDSSICRA